MTAVPIPLSALATSRRWQTNFVGLLPAITDHARIRFRRLPAGDRAEAVSESIARACVDYAALARKRQLHRAYAGSLAAYAVKAVGGGRRVGGSVNSKDVLSSMAQQKRRFIVSTITQPSAADGSWHDMMLESRRVDPGDQAAFNIDFAEWLKTFPQRHRAIIKVMAAGYTTTELALRFRVTLGRISQLRRAYETSWAKFQGEVVPELTAATMGPANLTVRSA